MDIFKLEDKKNKLQQRLLLEKSPRFITLLYLEYFGELVNSKNNLLVESYVFEFLQDFIKNINGFNVYGIDPGITENVIKQAEEIINLGVFSQISVDLGNAITRLKTQLRYLKSILQGNVKTVQDKEISVINSNNSIGSVLFPVIEKVEGKSVSFGLVENLSVVIRKTANEGETTFDIIPSFYSIESRLENQIKVCWHLAKTFLEPAKLDKCCFQVIIKFNNKYGEYIGNSLGATLTFAFISELSKLYKTRIQLSIANNTALTGSINSDGILGSVSKEIIRKKAEAIFFSPVKYFIVPKDDLKDANQALQKLKTKYPNRELSLIGIEDLKDLINRRNLVDIKKQNYLAWRMKKLYTPKIAFSIALIIIVAVSFFLFEKFDDNPSNLIYNNSSLFVLNKMGDTLWTTTYNSQDLLLANKSDWKYLFRLIDIDSDGENEVLLCREYKNQVNDPDHRLKIICYNKKYDTLWTYLFQETIRDTEEEFFNRYNPRIIDVVDNIDRKEIIISAQHAGYYATAIYRLDYNGKRIGETFWHPGGANFGFVQDIDDDGKEEVITGGINNGLECSVLFSIELDKLNGRAPSLTKYRFPDFMITEFDNYVLLPRTDYNTQYIYGARYNSPINVGFNYHKKVIVVNLSESLDPNIPINLVIEFNRDFSYHDIPIGDGFHVERDKLVKEGILSKPFTNTKAFKNLLKNQIKYWTGKNFISINDWNGEQAGKTDFESEY